MTLFIFRFLFALALDTIFSQISANECGTARFIVPKIIGGTEASRGAWPFVAALYYIEQSKFFCGGTLISSKHVLTAAHCVQQKNTRKKLTPEDVALLLGAYNLDVRFDRHVQQRFVDEIHVHPDWKAFVQRYDADLAIFVLNDIVEFTNYIRPICMPDDDISVGTKGSIVGWGFSENTRTSEHESILQHTYATLLNDSLCSGADFSSTRMFCSGGDVGSPQNGDSGGGFFVQSGSAWVQYGIISSSISDHGGKTLYSLYTNVNMFKNWIDEIAQRTGSVVAKIGENNMTKIDIRCNFEITYRIIYKCSIWGSNIRQSNLIVNAFIGTHISGHTSQNVSEIWFWTGVLNYVPNGIGRIFQNLEKFMVGNSNINLGLKLLRRASFRDMPLVWYFEVKFNDVETIDEDTLRDLPNLRYFLVPNNKLKVLHGKLFKTNTKLTRVNANSNQLSFLHGNLFKNNLLLEEASFKDNKLTAIYIDFSQLRQIKKIEFQGNECIDESLTNVNNLVEFQARIDNCNSKM